MAQGGTEVAESGFKPRRTGSRLPALKLYTLFFKFSDVTNKMKRYKWSLSRELGVLNIIEVDPLSLLQGGFHFFEAT